MCENNYMIDDFIKTRQSKDKLVGVSSDSVLKKDTTVVDRLDIVDSGQAELFFANESQSLVSIQDEYSGAQQSSEQPSVPVSTRPSRSK
ncbi:hypothetical protein V6N12_058794 [Hibiscus sabdariffa]|uniref:Uncharacterized protein n=1 Tax=Hibiscus sabdariffa TaxID=183260 RepID=A0ABR2ET71_9ROSI